MRWSFSFPLSLGGEGLAIVFHEFVEFALLVYNWLTRGQRGGFGDSVVSFPYLVLKTAHRPTQSRVSFYRFFLKYFCSDRADKSRSNL